MITVGYKRYCLIGIMINRNIPVTLPIAVIKDK
jgi:hypothetical protein